MEDDDDLDIEDDEEEIFFLVGIPYRSTTDDVVLAPVFFPMEEALELDCATYLGKSLSAFLVGTLLMLLLEVLPVTSILSISGVTWEDDDGLDNFNEFEADELFFLVVIPN